MIRSFLYRPDKGVKVGEGIDDFQAMVKQEGALLWVDMCKPTDEESYVLTNDFDFHPLAIDDAINDANPRSAIGYYEPGHYCQNIPVRYFLLLSFKSPIAFSLINA